MLHRDEASQVHLRKTVRIFGEDGAESGFNHITLPFVQLIEMLKPFSRLLGHALS